MAGESRLEPSRLHPGHDRDEHGVGRQIAAQYGGDGMPALRFDRQQDGLGFGPGFRRRIEPRTVCGPGLGLVAGLQVDDDHLRRRRLPLDAEALEHRRAQRSGADQQDGFGQFRHHASPAVSNRQAAKASCAVSAPLNQKSKAG